MRRKDGRSPVLNPRFNCGRCDRMFYGFRCRKPSYHCWHAGLWSQARHDVLDLTLALVPRLAQDVEMVRRRQVGCHKRHSGQGQRVVGIYASLAGFATLSWRASWDCEDRYDRPRAIHCRRWRWGKHRQRTVAPYFMWYNFSRIHQTLRATPAMEAGVANHVWSVEEVVGLLAD